MASERDIQGNALVLQSLGEQMVGVSVPTEAEKETALAAMRAGFYLFTTLLVDIHRIADAAEILASPPKQQTGAPNEIWPSKAFPGIIDR